MNSIRRWTFAAAVAAAPLSWGQPPALPNLVPPRPADDTIMPVGAARPASPPPVRSDEPLKLPEEMARDTNAKAARLATDAPPLDAGDGFRKRSPSAPGATDGERSEQNLSVEWLCPGNIRVKQPFICELVVRNLGSAPARDVALRNFAPEGMRVLGADPKPAIDGTQLSWSLGAMDGRAERRIRLEMVAERRGDAACNAVVTASTGTARRVRVTEPQLTIKQSAPERVLAGDQVAITITIANPGDGATDPVTLRAKLSDGLRGDKSQEMTNDIGTLAAGETRTVRLVCTSAKGGPQKVTTNASANGGLKAAAETSTMVAEPKVVAEISGPRLRYLEKSAKFDVKVSNPGDAPAQDVKVLVYVPAGFKPAGEPSSGGRYDYATRTMSWSIPAMAPGETKEFSYKCTAIQEGAHKSAVVAEAARGAKGAGELMTRVESAAALTMQIRDLDDPIEIGGEASYEIRIANQGTKDAADVELRALVPREMSVVSATGPATHRAEGQEIVFAKLSRLPPGKEEIFRVTAKGLKAGETRFRVRLTADCLTEPVIQEESTRIYADGK